MTSLVRGAYTDTAERPVVPATVVAVRDEEVTVLVEAETGYLELTCDRLHTAETPLTLAIGDRVLCAQLQADRGVVLGRIGLSCARASEPAPDAERVDSAIPDEIVIEARQNLTLKCGDGSITIRADGKILIKGKDLVSHAQNLNRIKGGAVAIN